MLEYFFSRLFCDFKYQVGAICSIAMGVIIIFGALGIQTIVIANVKTNIGRPNNKAIGFFNSVRFMLLLRI